MSRESGFSSRTGAPENLSRFEPVASFEVRWRPSAISSALLAIPAVESVVALARRRLLSPRGSRIPLGPPTQSSGEKRVPIVQKGRPCFPTPKNALPSVCPRPPLPCPIGAGPPRPGPFPFVLNLYAPVRPTLRLSQSVPWSLARAVGRKSGPPGPGYAVCSLPRAPPGDGLQGSRKGGVERIDPQGVGQVLARSPRPRRQSVAFPAAEASVAQRKATAQNRPAIGPIAFRCSSPRLLLDQRPPPAVPPAAPPSPPAVSRNWFWNSKT